MPVPRAHRRRKVTSTRFQAEVSPHLARELVCCVEFLDGLRVRDMAMFQVARDQRRAADKYSKSTLKGIFAAATDGDSVDPTIREDEGCRRIVEH